MGVSVVVLNMIGKAFFCLVQHRGMEMVEIVNVVVPSHNFSQPPSTPSSPFMLLQTPTSNPNAAPFPINISSKALSISS